MLTKRTGSTDGCGGVLCATVDQGSSPTLVIVFENIFLFTFSFCQTYLTNKITNSYKRAFAGKKIFKLAYASLKTKQWMFTSGNEILKIKPNQNYTRPTRIS